MEYLRFVILGCKDEGIMAKTHFHYLVIYALDIFLFFIALQWKELWLKTYHNWILHVIYFTLSRCTYIHVLHINLPSNFIPRNVVFTTLPPLFRVRLKPKKYSGTVTRCPTSYRIVIGSKLRFSRLIGKFKKNESF